MLSEHRPISCRPRAQLEGVCHEVQFGPNTVDLQYGLQSGIGLNGQPNQSRCAGYARYAVRVCLMSHQLIEQRHRTCTHCIALQQREQNTPVHMWPFFQLNVKSPPVGGLLIPDMPTLTTCCIHPHARHAGIAQARGACTHTRTAKD